MRGPRRRAFRRPPTVVLASAGRGGLHRRRRHRLRADLRPVRTRSASGSGSTVRFGDVTGPKRTALGEGYFVTWYQTWYAGDERVAEMLFRVLKFKPALRPRGRRARPPRPAVGHDTAFFWDGVAAGELRVQRCAECGALRHPPGPMCPRCHATKRDHVVACGRGVVHSYVVHHHPPVPGTRSPYAVALVELEEGVRMVGDLLGCPPGGRARRHAGRAGVPAGRRRARPCRSGVPPTRRCETTDSRPRAGRTRRAAGAADRADADVRGLHRPGDARLHARPPRSGGGAGAGSAGHLPQHPHHDRPRPALRPGAGAGRAAARASRCVSAYPRTRGRR